ncbi:MAG: hypothetical protein J6X66_01520 [Lachnospiraceae bacterium]|nr:hypothetical protein [Lachnospiraceae bacterium]
MTKEETAKIESLARKALEFSRDEVLMNLRFFAPAFGRLEFTSRPGTGLFATDGIHLFYDPLVVLEAYKEDEPRLSRMLLHSLLHLLFAHPFDMGVSDKELWDIACDGAVEAVIISLNIKSLELSSDDELKLRFKGLKQEAGVLSAGRLYRYFVNVSLPVRSRAAYIKSFTRDDHRYWHPQEKLEITQQQWEQLSRRIRTEIKAFSADKALSEALEDGLDSAVKRKYDYSKILRRFMVSGEHSGISPDEFDYVYYSYGLKLYGNMPLIEPLEYREEKRVQDMVIAIDTSASVSGNTVKNFIRRTFEMLRAGEQYSERVCIHIIQCDSEIQSDTVISDLGRLEAYLEGFSLRGFGGTDFRPVFKYVQQLIDNKNLKDMKGLVYFTDGYGIYPAKKPPYEVLFAFLDDDEYRPPVPLWAMKAVVKDTV